MHSEHTLQALFFTNSSSVHDHELKRTVGYSTRSGKQIRSDQVWVDIKRIISSMDGLEWNSTQRNEIEDGFFMVDDLPEDIFYQIHDGVCSSSPMMMMINRACGSISDIGMPVHSQQVLTKACDGDKTTDSLDSIDCLISTTSSAAVSSGESENNGSYPKTMINELVHEQVSRNSSDRGKLKRKNYQSELNFGEFDLLHSDSSSKEGGFRLIHENDHPKAKKLRSEKRSSSSNINFQQPLATSSSISNSSSIEEPDPEAIAQMKEMIYRAAAFRPVNLGLDMVEKPKRKNVRISTDPQTVAARQRRERISERIRVLQKLVPGGSKMDTASMLDEAASYLKFLRSQVKALENLGNKFDPMNCPPPSNLAFSSLPFNHMQTHNFPPPNPNQIHHNSQS